jgi:hypothetical protein
LVVREEREGGEDHKPTDHDEDPSPSSERLIPARASHTDRLDHPTILGVL